MGKQFEIRQAPAEWTAMLGMDRAYSTDADGGNRKDLPVMNTVNGAIHWVSVRKNPDGRWATGLDPKSAIFKYQYSDEKEREEAIEKVAKLKEELEDLTGKNLDSSPTNDLWAFYKIPLVNRSGSVVFKEDVPEDRLMLRVAIASGHIAPSKAHLKEDLYRDCKFYIHNPSEQSSKKSEIARKRAKAISLLTAFEDQKDRLYAIGKVIGAHVSLQMTVEALFDLLLEYVENTPASGMDSLIETLNADPKALVVNVKVKEVMARGDIFGFNKDWNAFTFLGKKIGLDVDQIISYFEDKKNENDFAALESKLEEKQTEVDF